MKYIINPDVPGGGAQGLGLSPPDPQQAPVPPAELPSGRPVSEPSLRGTGQRGPEEGPGCGSVISYRINSPSEKSLVTGKTSGPMATGTWAQILWLLLWLLGNRDGDSSVSLVLALCM